MASGISPDPGISLKTGISSGFTGISRGPGISGQPVTRPTPHALANDALSFALTDDAGAFQLTSQ